MQLKAEKVSFAYKKGVQILNQVDFVVNSGEVVGLTAPSGFGKTTLARILAGYERPASGIVTLDGAPLPKSGYNPVQLIFQHPEKAVNPKWKMRRVLEETGGYTAESLHQMGIMPEWLERWPRELSGGELQRFCVLRVLNERTRFIIADEMTTMLDAVTQAQIWNTVLDFAKKHDIGIVAISHERDLLEAVCTRIERL
ncbi:MAG: ATP-binding cassette domain-containing protein [Clostridiales bacterium]|jgi:peptide/nickel transport system ATP-binding protein|nr:ATP-binding cassette domain-containing protein [Clostridiales bacterium]